MSYRMDRDHESPSLLGARLDGEAGAPVLQAYEVKFFLQEEGAAVVATWALEGGGMRPDSHGNPALGGCYTTTTLYLDTDALDVYYRREGYAKRRYRIRRYGDDATVHLECKSKSGDRVSKQRSAVSIDRALAFGRAGEPGNWAGRWFAERTADLGLKPASMVTYRRAAFIGLSEQGPVRVTIDRAVRARLCGPSCGWGPEMIPEGEGPDVLSGRAIVELKYLTAMPLVFKSLMKNLTLHPASVSKYRLGREALGSPTAGDAPPAAGAKETPIA
ncbi:MAG: VTC domain-containing protein [Phycisphaerales bacterium]|nr:VTC domain-containing protein [Phycisphaerales bacterium]